MVKYSAILSFTQIVRGRLFAYSLTRINLSNLNHHQLPGLRSPEIGLLSVAVLIAGLGPPTGTMD